MLSRRSLFRAAFVAAGYFATRRVLPEPEEEPRTHVDAFPDITPEQAHLLDAFERAIREIRWDPIPMAARYHIKDAYLAYGAYGEETDG